MYKAFQGANGWYVAYENAEGYHKQPQWEAGLTHEQALMEARRLNEEGEWAYSGEEGDLTNN